MATLQRFIKIKSFRSAALMGVASLSLAACGSGSSQDDTTVKEREKAVNAKEIAIARRERIMSAKENNKQKRKKN